MLKPKKNLPIFSLLHFFFWSTYFTFFWINSFWIDQQGNLVAGQINLWGDWAAHFTMGSAMAFRNNVFSSGPFLINSQFSYPFLTNYISALLIKIGLPFITSFIIPSLLFSLLIILSLYFFYLTIFKNKAIAIISSNLFLLNGGTGFYHFFQDLIHSKQPLSFIINLPNQYTRIDHLGIKFINVIDSMIIPQRAFQLGFPLTLLALGIIYQHLFWIKKKKKLLHLVLAGFILGSLPIIHTHSFLVSFIILSCWSLYLVLTPIKLNKKNIFQRLLNINQLSVDQEIKKIWTHFHPIVILFTTTSLIALPLVYIFFYPHVGESFFKLYPGWLAREYHLNFFLFWFRNWTLAPLTALMSWVLLIKKDKNSPNFFVFLPFFVCFVLINLFLFQPFAWDNTKILIYSAVGFSGLNGWLTWQLFNHNLNIKPWSIKFRLSKKFLLQTTAVLLFLLLSMSGLIDAYYQLLTKKHGYVMYSKEDLSVTKWVQNNTNPQSIWLTGNYHNHWLFNLTGRQAVMTYPGWLWTHGYDFRQVEHDVKMMYQHPDLTTHLFNKYKIDYIVIGPQEKTVLKANSSLLPENFHLVYNTNDYQIYKTDP